MPYRMPDTKGYNRYLLQNRDCCSDNWNAPKIFSAILNSKENFRRFFSMSTRLLIKNINCTSKEGLIKLINEKFADIVVTDVHLLFKDKKFRHCAFVGVKSREDAKKLQSLDNYYLGTSRVKIDYARSIFEEQKLKDDKCINNERSTDNKEEEMPKRAAHELKKSEEQSDIQNTTTLADGIEASQDESQLASDSIDVINKIMNTSRLYITNIPYDCTEVDLKDFFQKFGPISEVHVPIDKLTKSPKGIAFIQFMFGLDAVKLYCLGGQASRKKYKRVKQEELTKPDSVPTLVYSGRNIFIYPGDSPLTNEVAYSLKEKRLQDKKKITQLGFNWNTLYLNPTSVVANMAKSLGMSEAEVLNVHEEGAAVRMGVLEVQELSLLKNWFEENGVSVDAFKNFEANENDDFSCKDERSDKILLVKNLTSTMNVEKFLGWFQKFGDIVRLLLPPSRSVAIIEYVHPTEAKIAFKASSYKPFDGLPLYLEWAPKFTFKKTRGKPVSKTPTIVVGTNSNDNPKNDEDNDKPISPVEESNNCVSVFVKNLNFNTGSMHFENLFKHLPGFRKALMKTKQSPSGELLSMGYGFVEFDSHANAEGCIRKLANTVLDGHSLVLRISQRETEKLGSKRKAVDLGQASTKIVIKNVPFEATRQELHVLLSTVCTIRSLRLPKKYDGGHRGFCFVECQSIGDAKQLIQKMNGVHFYGRHLIMQFSGQESANDALTTAKKRKVASV
eukprot:NODE_25_length_35605_cov_0.353461.p3 type:complete len:729 gc:universal NODE_25_length_35605_cov_0.353461:5932-3746(-)